MQEQTLEELREEIRVTKVLEKEREISNGLYAKKLVEVAVYSIIGLFCTAIFVALLRLIIIR